MSAPHCAVAELRVCRDCHVEQPVADFPLGANKKPRPHCRTCYRARSRERYWVDPERSRAHSRKWQKENREHRRAYKRAYEQTERGRVLTAEGQRRKRARTREQMAEYQKNYRQGRGRWLRLERTYGLTKHDFEAIWLRQEGRCAVCHVELSAVVLHVDHCHATNVVRGLLCQRCNQALGLLRDDADALRRAASYLEDSAC